MGMTSKRKGAEGEREAAAVLNDILGTDFAPEHQDSRVGDVRDSMAAIDRARELIAYEPRVDFRAGLERTAAWYQGQSAGTR